MRNSLVALFLSIAAANAHAQLKSATLKVLDVPTLTAMAPVVRALRAEPGTITLRVGQSMSLDALTVVVVDTAGHDRGKIVGFDFGIPPGSAAEVVPRTIVGKRPGTATLTVRFPSAAWKGRTNPRPATTVKVTVTP